MQEAEFAEFLELKLLDFYHRIKMGEIVIKIPVLRDFRLTVDNLHWHLFPEVFFQYEGSAQFCFKNEKILLSEGEVCLIPRAIPHAEFALKEVSKNLVVMVSDGITSIHTGKAELNKIARMQEIIRLKDPTTQRNVEYLDDVVSIFYSEEWNRKDLINSILLVYVSHLIHLLKNFKSMKLPLNQKVYKCKRLIMNNLHDSNLNVSLIAKNLDCSADYLSNLFHKEEGVNLSTYINQRRIQMSCEYLSNASLDVNEISKEVGFSSTGYFIKVFKKIMNQTPKAYRDVHKKQK